MVQTHLFQRKNLNISQTPKYHLNHPHVWLSNIEMIQFSNDCFTPDEIFEGIRSYNCNFGGNGYYIFSKMNKVIKTFNEILGLGLKDHYMNLKEIKKCLKY